MKRYLETIEEFGEELIKATALVRVDLFHLDNAKSLVKEVRRHFFHRLVYHLIYHTCRGQKDL